MKRFEVVSFTEFQLKPGFDRGFFDRRKEKKAWNWVAFNWGYWKFKFNYGETKYE